LTLHSFLMSSGTRTWAFSSKIKSDLIDIFLIICVSSIHLSLLARQPPGGPWPPHSRGFLSFLDHTQRRATVGRTPLDDYQSVAETTHNTHNTQTSMPPVGFEPTISAGERP
jgi:hypothetical protein